MSLEIQQREREGIVILDLKGRLTVGGEVATFRDRVQQLVNSGRTSIILNLQDVDYIDSTGLGALVMTKLTTIFEVFDDEQNAINSFFPDRELKRFDILSFVQQQKED